MDNNLLYVVVLIVLFVLLFWYFYHKSSTAERLAGNQIYTSGANMRILGQQFTSTDQGSNDIVYNDEIRKWNNPNKGSEYFSMPWDRKKNMNF